jgi:hypothetical protein
MQGPFRGVAGQLARVFGGVVTLHHGTAQARDVTAIFRRDPRMIDTHHGTQVQTMVPILRASRADLSDMVEGALVDPKDGRIYRFLFIEESSSPASDALVTAQLEDFS